MDTFYLPKEERRLLAGYFRMFGDVGNEEAYREGTLARLLRGAKTVPSYEDDSETPEPDMEKLKAAIKRLITGRRQVEAANRRLLARGLIRLSRHESVADVVVVSLTLEGFDLGRRYATWFTSTQLLFREYKDHWLWLLLGVIGGMLGTLILDSLRHLLRI